MGWKNLNYFQILSFGDDSCPIFFFKRCGHCKNLAPEWKKAANNLMGKVKLGHVDCDAEQVRH